ncbi:nucleotidyl transferase AbiEii/AbiGii toxin family protein [Nocardia takedensis]|uniref:nucleotidyl transferase AbiEii/AbiGii toxin family protein n=1 Tax=Nocardia takedensis TaxID=259390 RepID=UPI0003148F55|nr:nucleotidyl transferase AbiEii/AbiGii toxin family protein [Nocardia takedensis]
MPEKYASRRGFQAAINQRITEQARALSRPPAELHREFYMQRMLARVFADPASPWILKGGTALLVRISGARHSQDVDLLHLDADLERAFEELDRTVSATSSLDRLTFQLDVRQRNVHEGSTAVWQVRATPRLGTRDLQHFPIDLTAGRTLIDRIAPKQTIEIADVAPLPPFACYPLADQIADKLAAMYEYHGAAQHPSTRWRDLVDLLLILRTSAFDAAAVVSALDHQRARRPALQLPGSIHTPGPRWHDAYPALAASVTGLPKALHRLDDALAFLGRCMNPLLDGTVSTGTWNPTECRWDSPR